MSAEERDHRVALATKGHRWCLEHLRLYNWFLYYCARSPLTGPGLPDEIKDICVRTVEAAGVNRSILTEAITKDLLKYDEKNIGDTLGGVPIRTLVNSDTIIYCRPKNLVPFRPRTSPLHLLTYALECNKSDELSTVFTKRLQKLLEHSYFHADFITQFQQLVTILIQMHADDNVEQLSLCNLFTRSSFAPLVSRVFEDISIPFRGRQVIDLEISQLAGLLDVDANDGRMGKSKLVVAKVAVPIPTTNERWTSCSFLKRSRVPKISRPTP